MCKKKFIITAFIYDKRGNMLSMGKNSYVKTHPIQAAHAKRVGEPKKIFLHAEIAAIIKCPDISKAHKITVFRFTEDGVPVNSKPCKICQDALDKTPIKVIEHT